MVKTAAKKTATAKKTSTKKTTAAKAAKAAKIEKLTSSLTKEVGSRTEDKMDSASPQELQKYTPTKISKIARETGKEQEAAIALIEDNPITAPASFTNGGVQKSLEFAGDYNQLSATLASGELGAVPMSAAEREAELKKQQKELNLLTVLKGQEEVKQSALELQKEKMKTAGKGFDVVTAAHKALDKKNKALHQGAVTQVRAIGRQGTLKAEIAKAHAKHDKGAHEEQMRQIQASRFSATQKGAIAGNRITAAKQAAKLQIRGQGVARLVQTQQEEMEATSVTGANPQILEALVSEAE